jgi:hypothetical protein
MPLQKLQLRPGVNRESTTLANEGGWFECDKVRFRSGYPQKIGGWAPLSSDTYLGIARSLWNWVTLRGYNLLGVGTDIKYYIEKGGVYNDITPIRVTTTLPNNPFTTISGLATVTVNAPAHGAINGDYVTFSGATTVAGLDLNREFSITYINSNTYTITAPGTASSSTTGGGAAVVAQYQLNIATSTTTFQTGWGVGLWGGYVTGTAANLLNGGINDLVTTITVNSTSGFSASGTLLIDSELITYSGKNSTQFTGCVRGTNGTTAASHLNGTVVYDATLFTGWGQSASTTQYNQLRLWSEANFGEYLLLNPSGGGIYLWIPTYVTNGALVVSRAQLLSPTSSGAYLTDADCPTIAQLITVSDASRFVIAFGANDYGQTTQDPMLVRWSDQESYTVWTPAITNQAGSYRLSSGSFIVAAQQTRQEILIWTDGALYSMQYLGPPYVWGFNILSDNISIISPNAVATANNITYWMGADKFYAYSGRVETLPCALRQYVFGDINTTQSSQFFAGTNEGYSEVWWYYCSANSTVVDRYVIYNYLDQVWYYGTLNRSAWLDSPLRDYPMAATYSNNIVYHENGVDDVTTSGNILPITSYIQSSDFDIGDGHNYGFVWRMIPDITFDGSTTPAPNTPQVTFSVRPRYNPGAPYGVADTPTVASAQSYASQRNYTVQEFTQIVYTRLRGRQMAFKISSDTVGTQWQLGTPRIDVRPDGRR